MNVYVNKTNIDLPNNYGIGIVIVAANSIQEANNIISNTIINTNEEWFDGKYFNSNKTHIIKELEYSGISGIIEYALYVD